MQCRLVETTVDARKQYLGLESERFDIQKLFELKFKN